MHVIQIVLILVLNIVLKASTLSLKSCCSSMSFAKSSPNSYYNFLKLVMKLLKTNSVLILHSEKLLELPVTSMSQQFSWTTNKLAGNFEETIFKIANIQLKVIVELQKMFPDNFYGTSVMVETIVDLQKGTPNRRLEPLMSQFKDLLYNQLRSPASYAIFFEKFVHPSDLQLNSLYQLCLDVMDKLPGNAVLMRASLSTKEDSNFCLLLIRSLSENPQVIHLNPDLYDRLVLKITQLLFDRNLAAGNFRYLEKTLIKSMLSQDFWLSIICTNVISEFVTRLESLDTAMRYLLFFEKLMNRIWNQFVEPALISQVHVISIIKLILKCHPETARSKQELARLLLEKRAPVMKEGKVIATTFLNAFAKIRDQPTAENYYEMIISLRKMAEVPTSGEEVTSEFLDLIQMTATCDWNLFCSLIVAIMNFIISTADDKNKMVYLLKFDAPLSGGNEMPFEVKMKLLEMCFSFIPLAKRKIGLPGILTRELNSLLGDDDLIMKRVVIDKFAANISDPFVLELTKSLKFDDIRIKKTEEEKLNIIKKSKNFQRIHKCKQIKHAAKCHSSRPLQTILRYSQKVQSQQLTEDDRKVIQEIVSNFNKIAHGARTLKRPLNGC